MSDRPRVYRRPSRAAAPETSAPGFVPASALTGPAAGDGAVSDAVYEDLTPTTSALPPLEPLELPLAEEPPGLDGVEMPAATLWEDDMPEPPAPSGDGARFPLARAADAPRELPGYDEKKGFRIGPDAPVEARRPGSSVPVRVERPLPAPAVAAPPPPMPPPTPSRAQARRALRDRAELLRRNARLILAVFAVVLAAFALYAFLSPARYTAHSLLLINPQRPAGADQAIVGSFVDVPGLDARKVLNQALILQQAPAIAERTAQHILARPDAAGFPAVQALGGAPTVDQLADYIQNEVVSVRQEGMETDAVRVEATSPSAEEAATIARVYTDEYVSLTRETSRAHITQLREFLQEQVALRRGELDETERQLADYQAGARAVGLDVQTQSAVQQIATLQAALDGARVDAQMRAATVASLEREMAAVQPRMAARAAATAAPELAGIDAQIAGLERQLEQIYLRNPEYRGRPAAHPDLRTLTDRLARLQADKRRLAGQAAADVVSAGGLDPASTGDNGPGYVADLRRSIADQRAALDGARAQAGALSARLGEASGALTSVPERARRLAVLERTRTATATLLASLMAQLEQARVAEESEFGLAQVVREARVPFGPSSPNIPLLLGVGALLGLLGGLGAAMARHRLDARAHTPADLGESGFTVLGTIPDLGDRAARPLVPAEGSRVPATLVALTEPFSPEAEAFRHLHAAVLGAGGPGGMGPQVLLVAGPEVSTGKSLVSANLAVVAAQAGRRVLLLDADLRRPTVPRYLGLDDGRPPLGEGPEGANVVYWNTAVPGLFAVTAREAAEQPEALWSSEQAARLLAHVREAFDLIVVDAPAALVAADAAVLAPHCDAALLVAEAGRTDADALQQVATELAGTGLTQIAAVLNRFDARRAVGYRTTVGYRHTTRYTAARRPSPAPAPEPAAPASAASTP